jgi:hypothetical protein
VGTALKPAILSTYSSEKQPTPKWPFLCKLVIEEKTVAEVPLGMKQMRRKMQMEREKLSSIPSGKAEHSILIAFCLLFVCASVFGYEFDPSTEPIGVLWFPSHPLGGETHMRVYIGRKVFDPNNQFRESDLANYERRARLRERNAYLKIEIRASPEEKKTLFSRVKAWQLDGRSGGCSYLSCRVFDEAGMKIVPRWISSVPMASALYLYSKKEATESRVGEVTWFGKIPIREALVRSENANREMMRIGRNLILLPIPVGIGGLFIVHSCADFWNFITSFLP